MAKHQNLPLAPSEISGLCGRLLCCLAYENDLYVEMKQKMPKVGSQIALEEGVTGIVRGLNIISESVLVEVEGRDAYLEIKLDEISGSFQPELKTKNGGKPAHKK
jgi:cell fate regulator YaaT (PSP1 superfamily)